MPPRPLLMLVLVAAIQYPVMSGLPSFERTIGPAGTAGAPPRPPPPRAPAPRPPAGAGACPGAPPPCAGSWPARTWASMRTTARPTTMVKPCNLVFIGNLLKTRKTRGSIILDGLQVVALAFTDKLLFENLALVVHYAEILFLMPVQQNFDCPWWLDTPSCLSPCVYNVQRRAAYRCGNFRSRRTTSDGRGRHSDR